MESLVFMAEPLVRMERRTVNRFIIVEDQRKVHWVLMVLMVRVYRCSKNTFDGFVGFTLCVAWKQCKRPGGFSCCGNAGPKTLCAAKFGSAMLAILLAIYGFDSFFGFFWASFEALTSVNY